jgi:hypothetical protein
MSLLSLVSDAMTLCGFDAPTSVIGNTDPTVTLFKALSQVEGDILSRRADWRSTKVAGTLTGDGSTTLFDLPSDFDRFMTAYPFWRDNTPSQPLMQVTDDRMLSMKVAAVTPTRPVWRLFGDQIEFYPAPDSGDVVKYEYRSSQWILDDDGTTRKATWAEDADTAVFPERLITLGCIWRFKREKGFDYAEEFRTYQIEVTRAESRDGGRQTIQMRSHYYTDYAHAPLSEPRVIV